MVKKKLVMFWRWFWHQGQSDLGRIGSRHGLRFPQAKARNHSIPWPKPDNITIDGIDLQGGSDEAHQIPHNTTSQGQYNSVPGASVE
jgi:hypothetical protein